MPYVLLILGVGLGLYALYRFFLKASPKEIRTFFLAALTIVILLALFYMAVTGRLAPAVALVVALFPVARAFWALRKQSSEKGQSQTSSGDMSREEALDILGLDENADEAEIRRAYKELMKKVHPDTKGSQGLARTLNRAKERLLKHPPDNNSGNNQQDG